MSSFEHENSNEITFSVVDIGLEYILEYISQHIFNKNESR